VAAPSIGDVELCAWLDGETPPDRRAVIEEWLRATPEAAARIANWRRQNEIIRGRFARIAAEPVPDSLWPEGARREAPRPGRNIGLVGERDAPIQVERFDRQRRARRARLALAAGGAFIAGAAVALLVVGATDRLPLVPRAAPRPIEARIVASPLEALAKNAADAHRTYVRDASRPVETPATADISGYLSRRVGLEIVAPPLDAEGARLLGARVTPGDPSPNGLLVYEEPGGDRYGLLISRAPGLAPSNLSVIERRTSAIALWSTAGVGYALSGPNDPARLTRLARALAARSPVRAPR
jgi:anti-sigma factor RsiW